MPDPVSKYMEFWTGGMNTLLYPTNIAPAQYHYGENILCRGGIPQTRPGLRLRAYLPGSKLQGFTHFQQISGSPQLVVAIDGLIYTASYPYADFVQIQGISFDPDSEIVTFADCVKSVLRNPDGSLKVINPYRVLVIQDGVSRAGYWDGSKANTLDPQPPYYGTPTGLWMKWTSSRLWVARGSQIFVSDYADPLTFNENTIIAERSNFDLPDECTGLIETSDERNLLAFTRRTTTSFQSSIRDRRQWQTTPQFQQVLIPKVGCVSGRSPINAFGLTWWFSEEGWIDLNSALFTLRDSQLTTRDTEMMRSKRNLGSQLQRICSGWFENIVLVSVPSGDAYNAHTWVFDQSIADQLTQDSPPAWASIWTGFRPVEWTTVSVMGRNRVFCAGFDQTAYNQSYIHIWEAFQDDREDRMNRIQCQWETRSELISSRLVKFRYAELDLVEVLGDVNLRVYYAGLKGPYELIGEYYFQAEKGSIGSVNQQIINLDTMLQAYKPQTRTIKTKDVGSDSPEGEVCVESERPSNVDKSFSILCEWEGRMGIRGIRIVCEPVEESEQGECEHGDETGSHQIVLETGQGVAA